ncbi:MAG: hypothetical protein ACI4UC_08280, partial [Alloprevotella sp.]
KNIKFEGDVGLHICDGRLGNQSKLDCIRLALPCPKIDYTKGISGVLPCMPVCLYVFYNYKTI